MRIDFHLHEDDIKTTLSHILKNTEILMTELTDLQAAVAQVVADIKSETDELAVVVEKVVELLANPVGVSPADVAAVTAQLQATHQGVVDAVKAATDKVNPPNPPVPPVV